MSFIRNILYGRTSTYLDMETTRNQFDRPVAVLCSVKKLNKLGRFVQRFDGGIPSMVTNIRTYNLIDGEWK